MLAFVSFLLAVLGFAAIADSIREGDAQRYDTALLSSIHSIGTAQLDTFFVYATNLGGTIYIAIITIGLIVYLLYKQRKHDALLIATSVGGAVVINLVLKVVFGRTRPDLWGHLVTEASFSFPSGHAMVSSALAFAVMAVVWNTKWRYITIVVGLLYVALVGFSRLYLGVHYPTDVLGGWLVSLSWVVFLLAIIYTRRLGSVHDIENKH